MSDHNRRTLIAVFMFIVFVIILIAPSEIVYNANELRDYYSTFFMRETASNNAVTAIYLNYRIFDTLFETLLLLTSVIGIIYFSRHEGDV